MRYQLSFRRAAVDDVDTAAAYYDSEQEGLGNRFRDELATTLKKIEENPQQYPQASKSPLRKAVINVFPFCVYYRVEASRIAVLAVHDSRRDPAIWRRRNS